MQIGIFEYEDIIENRFKRHLKPEFEINSNIPNESLVIRLLLGTLSFTNNISTTKYDQLLNYSELGISDNTLHPISTRIIRECFEPGIRLDYACEYLTATKIINKEFFENLLLEITCYFQKSQEGSYTTAFLHLYRIIEYISYSFPLVYASISRDYYGSFNRLKNYFDKANSELLFFETFLKSLLANDFLETPLEINFNSLNNNLNKNHFNTIKGILNTEKIDAEVRHTSISTKYEHLFFLAVQLRNRYFHFAIGGKRNIKTTDIHESDLFFSLINEEIMNWISVIYFEILKASINKDL